eukprot:229868_1
MIKNSMRTQILRQDQSNIKKQLDLMGCNYESASIRSKDNTNFISGISMDINEQMKEIRQSMNDQRLEYKQRLDLQRKEYDEQNKQLKDVIRDLAIEKIEKKEIINKCNDLQNHIKNLQLQGTNGTTNNKDIINTNGTTLENIANTNGISLTENENEKKIESIDEEMSSDINGKNDENENVSFQDLIEEVNINKEDVKDKNVHNFNVGASDRNRVVKVSFPMNKIKGKSASAKATINLLNEKQVLSKIEYDDKTNKPKIYQKILSNGAILNQVWFKDDVATNGFISSCKFDKKRVYVNNWINDDELQRKRKEDLRYKMNDNNNWNAYNNNNNNNNLLDLNNINLNLLDLSKNTHSTPAPIKMIKNSMRTQILRQDQSNIKKQLDLMGCNYESASIRSKDNTNFISGISMDINEQMKEIRQSMNDQRLEYKQRLDLQRKEYDEQNKQLKDVIRDLAIEKIEKKEIINKCNDLQNHIKNLQLQGTNGTTNNKDIINTNGTTLENIANTNGISLTENENEKKIESIDEEMSSDINGKNDENENVSFQDLIEEVNINKEDVKDKNVHNFNVGASDRNRVVKVSFPMNKIKGKSASAKATINLLNEKQVLSKIEYDDKTNKPKIYQKILSNGAILNQVWFKDDVATNGFISSCKFDKKRVYVNNWINDDELQRKRKEDLRYKMNDNNNWNAYNNNNNNN